VSIVLKEVSIVGTVEGSELGVLLVVVGSVGGESMVVSAFLRNRVIDNTATEKVPTHGPSTARLGRFSFVASIVGMILLSCDCPKLRRILEIFTCNSL
jgi:hypothetical protein